MKKAGEKQFSLMDLLKYSAMAVMVILVPLLLYIWRAEVTKREAVEVDLKAQKQIVSDVQLSVTRLEGQLSNLENSLGERKDDLKDIKDQLQTMNQLLR